MVMPLWKKLLFRGGGDGGEGSAANYEVRSVVWLCIITAARVAIMGNGGRHDMAHHTWHVTRDTGHGAALQCWNIIDELEELYHNYLQCALQLKCSNTQLTASNWIMGLDTSSGAKLAHSCNCLKIQKPEQPEGILYIFIIHHELQILGIKFSIIFVKIIPKLSP